METKHFDQLKETVQMWTLMLLNLRINAVVILVVCVIVVCRLSSSLVANECLL